MTDPQSLSQLLVKHPRENKKERQSRQGENKGGGKVGK